MNLPDTALDQVRLNLKGHCCEPAHNCCCRGLDTQVRRTEKPYLKPNLQNPPHAIEPFKFEFRQPEGGTVECCSGHFAKRPITASHQLTKRPRCIFSATVPLTTSGFIFLTASAKDVYHEWHDPNPRPWIIQVSRRLNVLVVIRQRTLTQVPVLKIALVLFCRHKRT